MERMAMLEYASRNRPVLDMRAKNVFFVALHEGTQACFPRSYGGE